MAKFLDDNGILYWWNKIKAKFVEKADGKGLSTNDLTDAMVEKINKSGVYANMSEKPQIGGVELSGNKTLADIGVTAAINTAIGGLSMVHFEIMGEGQYNTETLVPTVSGEGNVFYLVPNGKLDNDSYLEYVYINGKFEYLGTTQVDLSGYIKKTDMIPITNGEIDAIVNA